MLVLRILGKAKLACSWPVTRGFKTSPASKLFGREFAIELFKNFYPHFFHNNNNNNYSYNHKSTWSYGNRVSKHFVIFLNFACLIVWRMFTVLQLCRFFFLFACFLVRDLCRSACRQNYYFPPPFPPDLFSLPRILSLTQVTVIRNQRAPQAGFGAV